jgi:hypothetical protein
MTYSIELTTPAILKQLSLTEQQSKFLDTVDYDEFLRHNVSFTYVKDRPLASAGYLIQDEGVAGVWALFDKNIGPKNFLQFHKLLKDYIDDLEFTRIETKVIEGHKEGYRWMILLGFQCEGLLRKYHKGLNFYMFSKVR